MQEQPSLHGTHARNGRKAIPYENRASVKPGLAHWAGQMLVDQVQKGEHSEGVTLSWRPQRASISVGSIQAWNVVSLKTYVLGAGVPWNVSGGNLAEWGPEVSGCPSSCTDASSSLVSRVLQRAGMLIYTSKGRRNRNILCLSEVRHILPNLERP